VVLAALSVVATLTLFAARRPGSMPRETRAFARNTLATSAKRLLDEQLPVGTPLSLTRDRMRAWRIPCEMRDTRDVDQQMVCFGDALVWSGVYARMSFRLSFQRDSLTASVACPTLVAWSKVQPPARLVARLREASAQDACWSAPSSSIDSASDSYWMSAAVASERPYNVQFIPAVVGIRDTVPPSADTLVVRW
jgi:hypothetical protein